MPATAFTFPTIERDREGRIIYPIDNGEPLSNDTEHARWILHLFNGLEDWFIDREDIFLAMDLLWYPVEGEPRICKAPDVMVALGRPPGPRSSYFQWEEENTAPHVVFEFLSKSNSAAEMHDKLDFYTDYGCQEYYIYDYQRGTFRAHHRQGDSLPKVLPATGNVWRSPLLDVTFGLHPDGKLWIKRGDGQLMQSHKQVVKQAAASAKQAEVATKQAELATQRARLLAEKLRELGVDPDQLS